MWKILILCLISFVCSRNIDPRCTIVSLFLRLPKLWGFGWIFLFIIDIEGKRVKIKLKIYFFSQIRDQLKIYHMSQLVHYSTSVIMVICFSWAVRRVGFFMSTHRHAFKREITNVLEVSQPSLQLSLLQFPHHPR